MDVKKLPFRCKHCRAFLSDNECIIFQIPAAGESHICKNFDLDFSRIFPASENPFTTALFHWCNTGIMSPGRNDLIKLIEIDPMRETVLDSHEWEQAKAFWLDWLIEKILEYSLQLMRVKEKTENDLQKGGD